MASNTNVELIVLNVPSEIGAKKVGHCIFNHLKLPNGDDSSTLTTKEGPVNSSGIRSIRFTIDGQKIRSNRNASGDLENFCIRMNNIEMPVIVNRQIFSLVSVSLDDHLFKLLKPKLDIEYQTHGLVRNLKFTREQEDSPWKITGFLSDLVKFESKCAEILGVNLDFSAGSGASQPLGAVPNVNSLSKKQPSRDLADFMASLDQSLNNLNCASSSTKPKPASELNNLNEKDKNDKLSILQKANFKTEIITGGIIKIGVDAIVNTVAERKGLVRGIQKSAGYTEHFPAKGVKSKFVIDVYVPSVVSSNVATLDVGEFLTSLRKCYENCLETAKRLKLSSIAFPVLTNDGIDLYFAAEAARSVLNKFAEKDLSGTIRRIVFIFPSKSDANEFEKKFFNDNKTDSTKNSTAGRSSVAASTDSEPCMICLMDMDDDDNNATEELAKCKHKFHKVCIGEWWQHKQSCPACGCLYGVQRGNQPPGQCVITVKPGTVPGFKDSNGIIEINYSISSGIQTDKHPSPGKLFTGTTRRAFLPNNARGQTIAQLLKLAFENGLVFTVGTSHTTGQNDTVVWNNIHHKTSIMGGPTNYGYPDNTYLDRVEAELKAVGIDKSMLK